MPPDDAVGTVFFCEIQFQKDQALYERILAEIALYFYRNRTRFSDWKIVVIYPSRTTEQDNSYPYRWLIASDQFHRVYLDELSRQEIEAMLDITFEETRVYKEIREDAIREGR